MGSLRSGNLISLREPMTLHPRYAAGSPGASRYAAASSGGLAAVAGQHATITLTQYAMVTPMMSRCAASSGPSATNLPRPTGMALARPADAALARRSGASRR